MSVAAKPNPQLLVNYATPYASSAAVISQNYATAPFVSAAYSAPLTAAYTSYPSYAVSPYAAAAYTSIVY